VASLMTLTYAVASLKPIKGHTYLCDCTNHKKQNPEVLGSCVTAGSVDLAVN